MNFWVLRRAESASQDDGVDAEAEGWRVKNSNTREWVKHILSN